MGAAGQLRRRTRARTPPGPRPEAAAAAGDDDDDVRCEACGSGEAAPELMLCDGCDCGFHIFCLRPILPRVPAGDWYCPSCRGPASSKSQSAAAAAHTVVAKKPKQFPLVQTKIVDFFKIQRSPTPADASEELKKRKRKGGGTLVASKKKSRRLLPFIPSSDPAQRLRQMASLATALTATGAAFSNELTYQPGMAPRSANRAVLEAGGMQVLNREDAETLARCRRMMARGEWPPLVVAYDPVEGFTVEADRCIRDLTIITEYVGDVDFLRNREHDDGDSMMTLLSAASPARSLVICPDRRSNIARFINGINNHTPEGRKKQNVKCVRFDVGGECRVLLVANRDISKGERLYYDYNGSEHEYPTHHFV
nr:histone-lysine N-methyltransferase [Saccharum hybrid cultivar R570]